MKFSRFLILLLSVLMLSGCSVTYNLDISSNGYVENVSVQYGSDDNFVEYTIPAFFGEIEYEDPSADFLTEQKGIKYYNRKIFEKDRKIDYNYKFDEKEIRNSNFINSGYNTFIIKRYDHDEDGKNDYMLFTTDDEFSLFNRFPDLESVVVNITCNYEVISSNADSVNENVYTWNLNRDEDKAINMVYNPDNEIDYRTFWEKLMSNQSISLVLLFLGIFVIGGIVFLIMKRHSEKVNRI